MGIKSYIGYKDNLIFILLGVIFGIILLVINSSFVLADTTLVSVGSEKIEHSFFGGIYSFFGNIASYCYIPIKKIAWFPMEIFNMPKKIYYTFVSESIEITGENILTVSSVDNSLVSGVVMEEEEVLPKLEITLLDNYLKELEGVSKKMEGICEGLNDNKDELMKNHENMVVMRDKMYKINNLRNVMFEIEKAYWREKQLEDFLVLLEKYKEEIFKFSKFLECKDFITDCIKISSNDTEYTKYSFYVLKEEFIKLDVLFRDIKLAFATVQAEIAKVNQLEPGRSVNDLNTLLIKNFELKKNLIIKDNKELLKDKILFDIFNKIFDSIVEGMQKKIIK